MITDNETVAEIVKEMRGYADAVRNATDGCAPDVADNTACGISKFADRIEAAHKREIAELRECLKEAIREMCPFTRMSCKHGEQCDYVCGTEKWRKALEGGHQ